MSLAYGKEFRLTSSKDFNSLKQASHRFRAPLLFTVFNPTSQTTKPGSTRIAFSISKKVGKAHLRNRLKRLFRESFRKSEIKFCGYDVLFIVSKSAREIKDQKELEETLLKSFQKTLSHLQHKA